MKQNTKVKKPIFRVRVIRVCEKRLKKLILQTKKLTEHYIEKFYIPCDWIYLRIEIKLDILSGKFRDKKTRCAKDEAM